MNTDSPGSTVGTVRGIARRSSDGCPMEIVTEVVIEPGRGIAYEGRPSGKRQVTFLSAAAWDATCRELGAELPWQTRRANFLIEGLDLRQTIGGVLSVGGVHVRIHNETKPCGLMDELHKGLRGALVPDCRGGVYGEVLDGGTVSVGDTVRLSSNGDLVRQCAFSFSGI